MLNIRAGSSLFFFSLALILIFAFTAAAQTPQPKKAAQKTAKKSAASKSGKLAPKLKPGVTRTAKKEAPKKTESPTSEAAPSAARPKTQEHSSDAGMHPATTPNPQVTHSSTAIKAEPKDHSSGDAAASAKTGTKTVAKEKPAPVKTAMKKAPAKAVAKKNNAASAPTKTAAKTAKNEVKEKPSTPAAKAEIKEKTTAVKKSEPKQSAVAKKVEAKKPPAPVAKKVEPKKTYVPPVKTKPAKMAETEETAENTAQLKVWLPRITADKVRADLNGTTLSDIPSEEEGDGTSNWLFTANQPKEIEILETDRRGDELAVEARLSTKKAKPNFDGSFDRLRGVARLRYTRAGSKWELKRVDNISLRHGDTNMDSPIPRSVQNNSAAAAAGVISAPPANILSAATIDVAAGKYRSYSFRVEDRAVLTGRFQARGGAQNDIEAYILDQDGFLNWSNDHSAPAYYNSGRLTVGTIEAPLSAGTYYLVFNNRYSTGDNKRVEASIQLRTDRASLARFETAPGAYNNNAGNNTSTINTIRRTYAPSADPAPAYVPPAKAAEVRNTTTASNPTKPAPNTPADDRRIAVAGYESDSVLSRTFNIAGGSHYAVPFSIKPGGALRGTFTVTGGDNIDAYIMTAREYDRWSSYREGVLDYSSGRVTYDSIDRKLKPGDYYLVFSNHFSPRAAKNVEAEIRVEYLPR